MQEQERKTNRKAAKKLIKQAKKHPDWYTESDVKYAKMIKWQTQKNRVDTN